jgi:hypothetical protein
VKKALKRLMANMALRKAYPSIYRGRDTTAPRLRRLIDLV